MISGKFTDERLKLPVGFLLAGEISFTIDFVVDNGFSVVENWFAEKLSFGG
jgi:predicted aspartyl protease